MSLNPPVVEGITDGQENSSKEFTLDTVEELIKRKAKDGWEFIFMGADIEAYGDAQRLGIPVGNTLSYHSVQTPQAWSSVSDSVRAYASSGGATSGQMMADAQNKLGTAPPASGKLKPKKGS